MSGMRRVAEALHDAATGIGQAVAEELKGVRVMGIDCDLGNLKARVEELKGKPGKFYPLQYDLTIQKEIERTVEWIEKTLRSVDILVNCAEINIDASCINGEIEEFKKTLDINILGLICITKEILKLMKKKGIDNGCIVNVNDVCGFKPVLACNQPISPAYSCSKSALTAWTECLRLELAQNESNIKIINICPGLVETEVTMKNNSRLPLKPKDLAEAVLFTLQTPENVLIKDITITPIREII